MPRQAKSLGQINRGAGKWTIEHNDLLAVARAVSGKGVRFGACPLNGGEICLNAEEVVALVEDEEAFWEGFYGWATGMYRYWSNWVNDFSPCTGTTAKGRKCGRWVQGGPYGTPPDKWVHGITDRCFHHQEILSQTENHRKGGNPT
jgi:hypothetical protein